MIPESAPSTRTSMNRVEQIMGMPIAIDVRDPNIHHETLERAFDWFRWVDATFSTYRLDSEICRINRGVLRVEDAHPDVRFILKRCDQLRFETEGYFDIRVFTPDTDDSDGVAVQVDPSGLVKGWSVDAAAAILDALGAHNYCVNAGGDVRVRGNPAPGEKWRIGIRHPFERDKVAAVVEGNDLAVATSGTYERGQHIINPHTGQPPSGLLSVTVTGSDLATADAYATAAFAMGRDSLHWSSGLHGYQVMSILDDETVLTTPNFPAVREPDPHIPLT